MERSLMSSNRKGAMPSPFLFHSLHLPSGDRSGSFQKKVRLRELPKRRPISSSFTVVGSLFMAVDRAHNRKRVKKSKRIPSYYK
jgi:hypothetical protein